MLKCVVLAIGCSSVATGGGGGGGGVHRGSDGEGGGQQCGEGGKSSVGAIGGGGQQWGMSWTSKNRPSQHKYVSKTVWAEIELKGSKST